MKILLAINIIFGILNSVLAFGNNNISAGFGWVCSALGWSVALIKQFQLENYENID